MNQNLKNSNSVDISIVVPLYNEEQSLKELAESISNNLDGYEYEIIFVDDGSTDSSWDMILKLRQQTSCVKGVRLRRNYGKSDAMQAGFEATTGRYVVTMDADLQDDPSEIPELINMLDDGYELVSGWKKKRYDPLTKTIPSRFFNAVTRFTTGIRLHDFNCGLKAYRKEVIDKIYLYGEMHRYVPLLAQWEGFTKIGEKTVRHHPRKYGNTKFGISRFLHGFLDLLTLLFVNRYMRQPMHFFGSLGVLFLVVGTVISGWLTWLKLYFGEPIGNRPLFFLGILLILVGIQFFSIGFLGEIFNKGRLQRQKPNISEKAGL